MSLSPDVRAVVRALDALTTQVRRIADTQATPVVDHVLGEETTCDDACRPVEVDGETIRVLGSCTFTDEDAKFFGEVVRAAKRKYQAEHGPAADEDALRANRRDSLLVLLSRASRGVLKPHEAELLRNHVEAEIHEHNTARSVARSNLRNFKTISHDLDVTAADLEQANGAARRALEQRQEMAEERFAWQERGDRAEAAIDRVRDLRDPIAEALEQADYSGNMRRGDLADSIMPVILAALDGTEQPTVQER